MIAFIVEMQLVIAFIIGCFFKKKFKIISNNSSNGLQ